LSCLPSFLPSFLSSFLLKRGAENGPYRRGRVPDDLLLKKVCNICTD
jgi:hypothetical protein